MSDEITRTAYHECGHAMAAVFLGGQIELLTIEPDNEDDSDLPFRYGQTLVLWPEGRWSDRELGIREIKVALAGPIVEMIYDETQFAPEFLEEWRYDWQLAVNRARKFLSPDKTITEHLAHIVNDILAFFERDDVWAAVAAMADLLEAYETLDAERIDDVLHAWPIVR